MAFTKTLLKYALYLLLALILLGAITVVWLRYEFSRVERESAELSGWDDVAVSALQAAPLAQPCASQFPQKKAWFGALHVHTEASFDATAFGTTTTVDEAYSFATGKPLALRLSTDSAGQEAPVLRISSPLDFMAVTDHAEALGERRLCYDEQSEAWDTLACNLYRGDIQLPADERMQSLIRLTSFAIFGQDRSKTVCGEDGMRCRAMAATAWQNNQRSTQAWHDQTSGCQFTTFHAYEYTLAEQASNLHRNIIFKSEVVPQEALSAKDAQTPEQLWQWLDQHCIAGNPDCDVLAIPHNSNWSSGRMWFPYSNQSMPTAEKKRLSALRAKLEPLTEIMQVKGDSECRNGIASVFGEPDEFCNFEKLRPANEKIEDCGEEFSSGGMMLKGCVSRYSFVRYALTAGLAEKNKLGVNPFEMGIVAASDTHIGAPAVAREKGHLGSHGNDRDVQSRLLGKVKVPGDIAAGSPVRYSPGGIAGVYASQNSRSALFEAMQQRETFGTSGPRITPRFFAGWQLDENLCESEATIEKAYAQGVPMGSTIPQPTASTHSQPTFMLSANRDARDGGNFLQRLQIVKGWIDNEGKTHQAVYDVVGARDGEASVDPQTCAVSGRGFAQLCSTWRDPEFNADIAAVYYMRALENPSCRWSQYDCLSLPEQERPASCSDPELPWQIQERAWTSPIWYYPES